jgi:hypothetical protein
MALREAEYDLFRMQSKDGQIMAEGMYWELIKWIL